MYKKEGLLTEIHGRLKTQLIQIENGLKKVDEPDSGTARQAVDAKEFKLSGPLETLTLSRRYLGDFRIFQAIPETSPGIPGLYLLSRGTKKGN